MTNTETLEFLKAHPLPLIETALNQLGYNLNDENFPESIVEDVEALLETMPLAVAEQKQRQLASGTSIEDQTEDPQNESLVVQETAKIAAEILDVRNISISSQALLAVAQSVVVQTKRQAAAINDLRRRTLVAELDKGQRELTDDWLQATQAGQKSTNQLFSSDNIKKMVDKAVPSYESRFNVDEFIAEVKSNAAEVNAEGNERVRVTASAHASPPQFDVDSFLEEVWD
jgi:hypothetical protein